MKSNWTDEDLLKLSKEELVNIIRGVEAEMELIELALEHERAAKSGDAIPLSELM